MIKTPPVRRSRHTGGVVVCSIRFDVDAGGGEGEVHAVCLHHGCSPARHGDIRTELSVCGRCEHGKYLLTGSHVIYYIYLQKLWEAYRKKFSYASDLEWDVIMKAIRRLYVLCDKGISL